MSFKKKRLTITEIAYSIYGNMQIVVILIKITKRLFAYSTKVKAYTETRILL